MKILYVATISNTINAFLIPHIKFLIEKGHEVHVACNVVNAMNDEITQLGCRIHHIEFQRAPLSKYNYKSYKRIKKLIEEEQYQLIHTHTPVASFLTRIACINNLDIKILYTAHGFHFLKGAPLKNWIIYYTMERVLAKWTDAIITINEEDYIMAKKMKLKNNGSVFKINGVGIDLDKFSPLKDEEKQNLRDKLGYKNTDFILFYAAELNKNKHQDLLIQAVKILEIRIPNIKLLLAGRGTLDKEYQNIISKLSLENQVELLGFRNDVDQLLKISDVLVASSRREGLPVNIMEAMATGLPLVVTDCRGQRDLVINNQNGYVVSHKEIDCFADKIDLIYRDSSLRKLFSNNSLDIISNYSIESVLEDIEKIYSRYLNS